MIKPKTIVCLLFVLIVSSVQALEAQSPAGEPAEYFGVKGGLNAAWLRNDDPGMDERLAPAGGIFASLQSGGLIGFQVEALYTAAGYVSDARMVELDYIQVPLLLTLKLPGFGPVRPFLMTGPAGAVRVRTMYGTAKESKQESFRNDVRRWDVAWVASVALDFSLPRGGLIVEGRYSLGLMPVFVDGSSYASGSDKNRAYVGLVGYRF